MFKGRTQKTMELGPAQRLELKLLARKIDRELEILEKDADRLLRLGVITKSDREMAQSHINELYSILLVWG